VTSHDQPSAYIFPSLSCMLGGGRGQLQQRCRGLPRPRVCMHRGTSILVPHSNSHAAADDFASCTVPMPVAGQLMAQQFTLETSLPVSAGTKAQLDTALQRFARGQLSSMLADPSAEPCQVSVNVDAVPLTATHYWLATVSARWLAVRSVPWSLRAFSPRVVRTRCRRPQRSQRRRYSRAAEQAGRRGHRLPRAGGLRDGGG
jgi:hypothetical protein